MFWDPTIVAPIIGIRVSTHFLSPTYCVDDGRFVVFGFVDGHRIILLNTTSIFADYENPRASIVGELACSIQPFALI